MGTVDSGLGDFVLNFSHRTSKFLEEQKTRSKLIKKIRSCVQDGLVLKQSPGFRINVQCMCTDVQRHFV